MICSGAQQQAASRVVGKRAAAWAAVHAQHWHSPWAAVLLPMQHVGGMHSKSAFVAGCQGGVQAALLDGGRLRLW